MANLAKQIGFVETPQAIARELVSWAVRSNDDTVLDIGAGQGVFLCESARRLKDLGASDSDIVSRLHGIERDRGLYECACAMVKGFFSLQLPNFVHGDLFDREFPELSAIVGNPPYVRRNTLDEIDRIRERVIYRDLFLARLPRLTDLYSYFIIYATQFLKPGGRLGVIISSSWMDTGYGIGFKEYLLRNFRIRLLAVCEQRLFESALVKAVMVFAEKGKPEPDDVVKFLRLPKFVHGFSSISSNLLSSVGHVTEMKQADLDERHPWGVYVRQPDAYLSLPPEMSTTLGKLARTRIGIQPLARHFYIIERRKAELLGLPGQNLEPLAHSPRDVSTPIIEDGSLLPHWILVVRDEFDKIESRPLAAYIKAAEKAPVRIRGKDTVVYGYHNVPRLQKTGRSPWYNIADDIRRRGRFSIFLPRRFHENFLVIWNKAGVVANENFIEAQPYNEEDTLLLLSILNSSFFELCARSRAQQYGGGVFNLNPLDVQELPILDHRHLSKKLRQKIEHAFSKFLKDVDRNAIDDSIAACFDIGPADLRNVQDGVKELRRLSSASKHVAVV